MEISTIACQSIEELYQTWELDKISRFDSSTLRSKFHAQVPILKYLDWKVIDTERGFCESMMPLNVASTNQHITHQAAVMMIAADYTGGVALSTLINQVPIVGIHSQPTEYGAYLWAGKAEVKWINPSCADLICKARIEEDKFMGISKRFFQGSIVLFEVKIDMYNGETLVAESKITYWMQDTFALRRNAGDIKKIHPLYAHKQKTSANLISGLRFLEQRKPISERLFTDTLSEKTAGIHGKILANRFNEIVPQLQPMVAARTRNCDDLLTDFIDGQPIQLINIGIGIDTRHNRIEFPLGSVILNLDLPTMLEKRNQIFTKENILYNKNSYDIPVDLLTQSLSESLLNCSGFNANLPSFVIWEGGSMYFAREQTKVIINSLKEVLNKNKSILWMDYVDDSIIKGTSGFIVVDQFIESIRMLGEPFINGYKSKEEIENEYQVKVINEFESNYYIQNDDEVFKLYKFCEIEL